MLRFYELFDPAEYQNTERQVSEATVNHEQEIAAGHYVLRKYEEETPSGNQLPQSIQSATIPASNK